SPDRKKVAVGRQNLYPTGAVAGSLELYDFNPATGIVSNQKILDRKMAMGPFTMGFSGVCFSPDNSKLYGQNNGLAFMGDPSSIHQYDLAVDNIDSIIKSKTFIVEIGWESHIKAGPDGKLYFHNYDRGYAIMPPEDSILGVI